jgi:hypothetical protein
VCPLPCTIDRRSSAAQFASLPLRLRGRLDPESPHSPVDISSLDHPRIRSCAEPFCLIRATLTLEHWHSASHDVTVTNARSHAVGGMASPLAVSTDLVPTASLSSLICVSQLAFDGFQARFALVGDLELGVWLAIVVACRNPSQACLVWSPAKRFMASTLDSATLSAWTRSRYSHVHSTTRTHANLLNFFVVTSTPASQQFHLKSPRKSQASNGRCIQTVSRRLVSDCPRSLVNACA